MQANEQWTPLHDQVNDLMHEEKQARQLNDANKCSEICQKILTLAWEKKQLNKVRDWLPMLVKRRGQAKKAVVDMVQLVIDKFMSGL